MLLVMLINLKKYNLIQMCDHSLLIEHSFFVSFVSRKSSIVIVGKRNKKNLFCLFQIKIKIVKYVARKINYEIVFSKDVPLKNTGIEASQQQYFFFSHAM